MEFPVVYEETEIGTCTLEPDGLYWQLSCRCRMVPGLHRLYAGTTNLGVLIPAGGGLQLHRRLSKAGYPALPPKAEHFALEPEEERQTRPWKGRILDCDLEGTLDGDELLFPYDEQKPCPCEPLCCFFEIRDGFWRLNLKKLEQIQGSAPA